MSHHDPRDDRLGQSLRHHADRMSQAGDHPISLADVQQRARSIRRRRAAVTGLAAAAVLAVAIPAGIAVNDRVSGDGGIPAASPSVTPDASTTPTADPGTVHRVLLTTQVERHGGEPGIPYVFDGAINLPDGSQVPVQQDYDQVAALGDGWLATYRDKDGNAFVDFLDSNGAVTDTRPSTGSLAVAPVGSLVAYATPQGELVTVTLADGRLTVSEPQTTPSTVEPVGVVGSGTCKGPGENESCTVYYDVDAPAGSSAWLLSTWEGGPSRIDGFLSVTGVAPDQSVSGVVSVSDSGSCSAVRTREGQVAWRTCDYTLGRFSPDGRYVLGYPAYRDGIGDGMLAILDARTGDVLAEYQADETTQAFVNTAVWDLDDTVLATVWEKDGWSLMRMTPDGVLSNVSAGGLANGRNMDEVPLHFSARP